MLRTTLLLVVISTTAHAQPAQSRLGAAGEAHRDGVRQEAPLDRSSPLPPSATAAMLGSVGVTVVGVALGSTISSEGETRGNAFQGVGLTVMVLAPVAGLSVGNVWLGETYDALIGSGLRAVGAAGVAYGLSQSCWVDCSGGISGDALLVTAGGGGLLFLVGAGYDLATQHRNGTRARLRATEAGLGVALAFKPRGG